jgi:uncharacterized protein YggT (Ycf19 family)
MPYAVSHEDRVVHDPQTTKNLVSIANVIWYVFAIAEAFLLFRLVLRFVGATAANGLIDFIYTITRPLVAPFSGILGSLSGGRGILELDTILAMLVYWLIATVLISLLKPRYVAMTTDTVHEHEHHDHTITSSGRRRDDYRVVG